MLYIDEGLNMVPINANCIRVDTFVGDQVDLSKLITAKMELMAITGQQPHSPSGHAERGGALNLHVSCKEEEEGLG